jgi:hypothetical protein
LSRPRRIVGLYRGPLNADVRRLGENVVVKPRFVILFCGGVFLHAQIASAADEDPRWAFNAPRAGGYSINLQSAEPAPGTPLLRGATVPFKATVTYALETAAHGKIVLVFQDESNQAVTGEREQSTVEVVKGSGIVTLADSIVVPSGSNELQLFIPLVPDGLKATTGEITLRYPITTNVTGPQYMPHPVADISVQQWEDFRRLVEEAYGSSRRAFPDEHLEVFDSTDNVLHFAFTTAGHAAHPAWITRRATDGSVDQIGYFAGTEEPFAELFRAYLALTDRTLKKIPEKEAE